MRDDQVDDAVGEVDEDDLDEEHAEVHVENLIVVFGGGYAVTAGPGCFHGPVEGIDVGADPAEGLLHVDVVEEVGAVEPEEAHVVELALDPVEVVVDGEVDAGAEVGDEHDEEGEPEEVVDGRGVALHQQPELDLLVDFPEGDDLEEEGEAQVVDVPDGEVGDDQHQHSQEVDPEEVSEVVPEHVLVAGDVAPVDVVAHPRTHHDHVVDEEHHNEVVDDGEGLVLVELVVGVLGKQQHDGYLYEVEENGEKDGHVPVEQHQRLRVDHHLVAPRLLPVPMNQALEEGKLRLWRVLH